MFILNSLKDLKGKKVLVAGFSLTGEAGIKFLLRCSAKCYLTDSSKLKDENIKKVEEYKKQGVSFEFGSHSDEFIKDSFFALLSPSIPETSEIIQKLKKFNIPYMSDLELAYRLKSKHTKMAVITGTNGKTTTTMLVSHILSKENYSAPYVGNVGVSPLDYLNNGKEPDCLVCEASSYQLHYSSTLTPDYGVLCNVTPDHINWHGNFENYLKDKSDIFLRMNKKSDAILNFDDKYANELGKNLNAKVHYFILNKKGSNEDCYYLNNKIFYNANTEIIDDSDIPIPGPHNIQNVMSAILIAIGENMNPSEIREKIMSFKAPPHRCEFIEQIDKVKYYNDSKATNPEASIVAINSFVNKNVSLIAGGRDKNTSLDEFTKAVKKRINKVVLIGEAAERFNDALTKCGFNNIVKKETLEEAIDEAAAQSPDTVLFSPACASFDMFKNYEQRGEAFREYVLSKIPRK